MIRLTALLALASLLAPAVSQANAFLSSKEFEEAIPVLCYLLDQMVLCKAGQMHIVDLCSGKGFMGMILVTHDMELASRLPHQIVMEDGRIVQGGDVS